MRKLTSALLFMLVCSMAKAQSGTNSPYSQFGLGLIADQSNGASRGMNGVGLAFHEQTQVNFLNPASYAHIDSLTFLFDAGVALQTTNYKENNKSINIRNANFEYVTAGFRLARGLGMSFGLIPLTNIGYKFSSTDYVDATRTTSFTNTYSGTGGLHQIYIGMGYSPFRNFSIGANLSYLWGSFDKSFLNAYSETTINTLYLNQTATIKNYKVDLGAQYELGLNKKDRLTLALTFSPGHKIGGDPQANIITTNASTAVSDTTIIKADGQLSLPNTWGAGLMWNHDNRLKIGLDYTLQQWGSLKFPLFSIVNETPRYNMAADQLTDRHRFAIGGDYTPNPDGHSFASLLHYRAGVAYTTPYFNIYGNDGPKEISASFGIGMPLRKAYNSKSMLNISAQYVHTSANRFITENMFRINVSITFNERWFMKWKVE